jgi:hypothetical protein
MADTFSIGLANQGLKALVNSPQNSILMTIPTEINASVVLAGAAETDVITLQTVAANKKVTITSITVTASNVDNIFKLYRNGVDIATFVPKVALQTIQMLPVSGGKEFDETETWKLTVTSAGAAGTVKACASGRSEMKRNELFSQVLA